jgi:hypothetical protein
MAKFTNENTNGLYDNDLLDEMNDARDIMLDDLEGDNDDLEGDNYDQHDSNVSGWIMEVAEADMTAADIVAAASRTLCRKART